MPRPLVFEQVNDRKTLERRKKKFVYLVSFFSPLPHFIIWANNVYQKLTRTELYGISNYSLFENLYLSLIINVERMRLLIVIFKQCAAELCDSALIFVN